MSTRTKAELRVIRHARVRKRVVGTTERPRLAVYKSLKHVCAQLIDDSVGKTIASASTLEKDLKAKGNVQGARLIGKALADRAKKLGVESVVFDRGGFRYAGCIAEVAEGAREGGLSL